MVYKKRVQKLFDLKPVNNPFWFFYKGFVLNRYDRRRLNKIQKELENQTSEDE